jgi:hypothetical protein
MKICPEDEFTNGVLQGGVSREGDGRLRAGFWIENQDPAKACNTGAGSNPSGAEGVRPDHGVAVAGILSQESPFFKVGRVQYAGA